MTARALTAVIWDFDGTLADTRQRNFNVVRRLLREVGGRDPDRMPALESSPVYETVHRRYANWRELYLREFGFSEEETDRVGQLWTRYQLEDDTPAPVFDGIASVLAALRFLPHGIVSMNGRSQIARSLREANLHDEFGWIVGWEDVGIRRQKPEPDGLLACLEGLTGLAPGTALYVGDHETDAACAAKARQALARKGTAVEIVTVAALFVGDGPATGWTIAPDFSADTPHDVIEIARRLHDGD